MTLDYVDVQYKKSNNKTKHFLQGRSEVPVDDELPQLPDRAPQLEAAGSRIEGVLDCSGEPEGQDLQQKICNGLLHWVTAFHNLHYFISDQLPQPFWQFYDLSCVGTQPQLQPLQPQPQPLQPQQLQQKGEFKD